MVIRLVLPHDDFYSKAFANTFKSGQQLMSLDIISG